MALLGAACASNAATIDLPTDLGLKTFNLNAFATGLADSRCSATCLTFSSSTGINVGPFNTATIAPFVIGSGLDGGVGLGEGPAGAALPDYIVPQFGLLASIANGPGADFVIWEAGNPAEPVNVSVSLGGGVFSAFVQYVTAIVVPADNASGFQTNSVHIDLADFGLAAGALIDQVRIEGLFTGVGGSGPDILAVAALNVGPPTITVPEPGTLATVALALGGLALGGRVRRT